MSVPGWCKANNIPFTACRQWLTRIKKDETQPAKEQTGDVSIWGKVDFLQANNPGMPLPYPPGYPSALLWLEYRNRG
ncbi:MAG: hypothetical protein AAGU75_06090 [Bacillota bacterium]